MKKVFSILLTFSAILFATGTNGQNFVDVTKSNNGQTINLSSDQVLEVKLPKNPSTGYTWCESDSFADKTTLHSIAQIEDDDFIAPSSRTTKGRKIVGRPGTQIVRFVGTSQGTSVLTLELKRPWEKNNTAIDNFTITIISGGKYTGNYMPSVKKKNNTYLTSTLSSLPSKWDWRAQCTPIANQMQCGDCWAFAGAGVLECNIKITDGLTRDISEEYLTNCDTAYFGCNGGECPFDYWLSPKGAVYESEDPWTATEGNGQTGACGGPYVYHETINSWGYVPGENTSSIPPDVKMKNAIYNYGPIWVGVDASSTAWQNYTSTTGIYTGTGTNVDHAVCLVGWCDSATVAGGGYWILRNSWGASWGKSGYMYISYGSDAVGTDAAYIVYKCRNNDFEMLDIKSPVTACGLSNAESISAQITYNGCNIIPAGDTLFTAYKADNSTIKNDTIVLLNHVNSGDTLNYTFNSQADFSVIGTHTITCWVKYKNDTLALNDSINGYTFENKLHENIDVGVSSIKSPVSSCHMTNAEPVKIDVKFYGCDSLNAGNSMVLAYRINGGTPVKDTILVPHTIMPEETFNHVFTTPADLSLPGNYTIDAWTEYSVDTLHTNDMLSGYIVRSPTNIGFDTITFEEPSINNMLLFETTPYSHALVSAAAHHTGTKGLLMTGGNPLDYIYNIIVPDSTNIWTVNNFLSAKVNFCVDATGWSGFNMRFDLKQTDGGDLYTQYLGAGDYSKTSSLRILINGVQIGGTYNPTTTHADPWVTHFISLDTMAGKQFSLTIETRNIARDTTISIPWVLDNAYIDNVCFSPVSQQSVKDYNTDISMGVYPNPFKDDFTVKYDADKQEKISLEIIDMLGRTINSRSWNVGIGSNRLDINLDSFPAGMYMIKVTSSKGFAVKNIVKQ